MNVTNCRMIVGTVDIKVLCLGIIHRNHHLAISINHFSLNERRQLICSERVKNSAANVIEILANLLYKRNSRALGFGQLAILFNLIKKGGKGITNNVRNLASVNPIERTVLYTILVFVCPLDTKLRIKCVCFVLRSAEQIDFIRCKTETLFESQSDSFIVDAFTMNAPSSIKTLCHVFNVEFHE